MKRILSLKKRKDDDGREPVDQLEDKEVGAAASRDCDLDCVPTSLAHLSQQYKYFFFEVPMVLDTQYSILFYPELSNLDCVPTSLLYFLLETSP